MWPSKSIIAKKKKDERREIEEKGRKRRRRIKERESKKYNRFLLREQPNIIYSMDLMLVPHIVLLAALEWDT